MADKKEQKHSFRSTDSVCTRCGLTRSDYIALKAGAGEEVPCPYKPTKRDLRVNG